MDHGGGESLLCNITNVREAHELKPGKDPFIPHTKKRGVISDLNKRTSVDDEARVRLQKLNRKQDIWKETCLLSGA